jgi:hypothetical protein
MHCLAVFISVHWLWHVRESCKEGSSPKWFEKEGAQKAESKSMRFCGASLLP